jgi:pimeloyl-ACP methyl ester carboxylesterase
MNKKVKLYFIPGLGCDQRIFDKLIQLLPLSKEQILHLEHLEPTTLTESMDSYVERLVKKIPPKAPDEYVILIGLSLGGMIATALNKTIAADKLIILSSITHESERPWLFRFCVQVPIYRLTPTAFTQHILPKLARWFRFTQNDSGILFEKMVQAISPEHLKWGRYTAINWQNSNRPQNYIHIHGTKDHIFNHKSMQVTHWIEGATHSMVMDNAVEIAPIITKEVIRLSN